MHQVKRCKAACITDDIRHVVCNPPIIRSFTCCKGCLVLCRIYAGSAHMWSGWWWSRRCGNHSTHPQSCRQSYIIFKKHGRRWADMCKHALGCLAIDDSMQHARRGCCLGTECLAASMRVELLMVMEYMTKEATFDGGNGAVLLIVC